MRNKFRITFCTLALAGLVVPFSVKAVSLTTVTSASPQGWSTADTRPGGAVGFVLDATAPSGVGALQMTTDATTAAKAQYMHAGNIALTDVTDLSYYTKQNSAAFSGGDVFYQLPVF